MAGRARGRPPRPGPAALLLQVAHPLVAEGVAAHSDFERDPFGRLRRTLRTTLALVFGDGAAAERAESRLDRVHARVGGEVRDPLARATSGADAYRALDPQLLLWVQATLEDWFERPLAPGGPIVVTDTARRQARAADRRVARAGAVLARSGRGSATIPSQH